MGFSNKIKQILEGMKPKVIERSCKNFWCKVRFEVEEEKYNEDTETFGQCKKCRSFSNELSGGVTNNGFKEYDGDRFDSQVHEIDIKSLNNEFFKGGKY